MTVELGTLTGAIVTLVGLVGWMLRAFLRHINNHEAHTLRAIVEQTKSNAGVAAALDKLADSIAALKDKSGDK